MFKKVALKLFPLVYILRLLVTTNDKHKNKILFVYIPLPIIKRQLIDFKRSL